MSAAPAAGGPAPPGLIRPATDDDLWAVRDLLTMRDHRAWDDASTRWFVRDLDPERCLAWLAFAGPRPVGLSTLFLRDLIGPTGRRRVGYWANLFIDPEYRDQLLYPRLPLVMFAKARALGLAFIYGSVRLRDVALAHTRLGFGKIGEWRVLMKPLRPFRLLGKVKGWAAVEAAAAPADALYAAFLGAGRPRPAPGLALSELDPGGAAAAELVAVLDAAAASRITDSWSAEAFAYRYGRTREGTRYQLLGVSRGPRLVGGVVTRVAERWAGIQAGIVMDVICPPGEEPAMAAALAEAERRASRQGCEVMLFLDGLGAAVSEVFRRAGYRGSPERYDLLIWPREALGGDPALADLAHWRFAFGDHDAF